MNEIFRRAEEFIWKNARTLERQRFAFYFQNGSGEAVLKALLAYQNEDGGFGNAMEPDIRCPDSQTIPVQHALEILDEVGWDEGIVRRACDFLLTVTTEEGGVPFALPSVMNYPRAPWWNIEANPPTSLNPTAAIAGLMHKNNFSHPWLDRATAFCWSKIPTAQPTDFHELGVVFTFLQYVPDRVRAEKEWDRLSKYLLNSGLVADVQETGYVRKPLDWAPTPDHPLRPLFSEEIIQANLKEVLSRQQEDGGWTIPWPPLSPGCVLEWRGWVTVDTLKMLKANHCSSV